MQTTDKAVAVHYGQDTWSGHELGYVLEFPLDSLNRGALIQWLSQYPGETDSNCSLDGLLSWMSPEVVFHCFLLCAAQVKRRCSLRR